MYDIYTGTSLSLFHDTNEKEMYFTCQSFQVSFRMKTNIRVSRVINNELVDYILSVKF